MCKKLSWLTSEVSNVQSVAPRPKRISSVIAEFRALWLVALVAMWTMTGLGGVTLGANPGVDDPADMADANGDIKRIEAWVDDDNLNLTMTVYGVFAPTAADMAAGPTSESPVLSFCKPCSSPPARQRAATKAAPAPPDHTSPVGGRFDRCAAARAYSSARAARGCPR